MHPRILKKAHAKDKTPKSLPRSSRVFLFTFAPSESALPTFAKFPSEERLLSCPILGSTGSAKVLAVPVV